jgi:hypothetical protein
MTAGQAPRALFSLLLLRVEEGGNSRYAMAAMIGCLGKDIGKDIGKDLGKGRIHRPRPVSDVIFGISPLVGGIDRITRARAHKSNLLASV